MSVTRQTNQEFFYSWDGLRLGTLARSEPIVAVSNVDECRADGKMRIHEGNQSIRSKHALVYFVHHKSHKT
jgi:hypothetical protein